MTELTNRIQNENELSLKIRSLLKKGEISTFKQLARLKRWTLLRKIPELTVRHLVSIEIQLKLRELKFCPDDTISVDYGISQRRLFLLWEEGIYLYSQFRYMYYWDIVEALGGKNSAVFKPGGTKRWFMMKNILYKRMLDHQLCKEGLSEETAEILYREGFCELSKLTGLTDLELAKVVSGSIQKPNILTRARMREVKYVLQRNGYSLPHRPL